MTGSAAEGCPRGQSAHTVAPHRLSRRPGIRTPYYMPSAHRAPRSGIPSPSRCSEARRQACRGGGGSGGRAIVYSSHAPGSRSPVRAFHATGIGGRRCRRHDGNSGSSGPWSPWHHRHTAPPLFSRHYIWYLSCCLVLGFIVTAAKVRHARSGMQVFCRKFFIAVDFSSCRLLIRQREFKRDCPTI